MPPNPTVLYATDFSDCSRCAFRLARTLAGAQGARLIVLHVNATPGPLVAYGEALAWLQPADYPRKLEHALRHFQVLDAGVRVEHRLVEGDPATEILRVAAETGCDTIVMGTHGRTGLERLLLGSVAERVVRRATCPVVTVKAPRQPVPSRSDAASHGASCAVAAVSATDWQSRR
jgi:nucleotide-binding universal stress UspA family protein